jgi:hypothetical protein
MLLSSIELLGHNKVTAVFTKQLRPFLFSLLLISSLFSEEKVLVYTYSYNRPDFIEMQAKTFKKFLKDDYEFIVFNDAPDFLMQEQIRETCFNLEIECIDIPQCIHEIPYLQRWPEEHWNHPAIRNCNVVQYSLDNYGFMHNGLIVLLDSDVFLVKEFSFKKFLEASPIAGLSQSKSSNGTSVEYLWIGFAIFDFGRIPHKDTLNFNCGYVENIPVDAGGHTYYYLRDHPTIPVKFFSSLTSSYAQCSLCQVAHRWDCTHNTEQLKADLFDEDQIAFIQSGVYNCDFLMHNTFLHYRGGTNWDGQTPEYHQRKTELFNRYINTILHDNETKQEANKNK